MGSVRCGSHIEACSFEFEDRNEGSEFMTRKFFGVLEICAVASEAFGESAVAGGQGIVLYLRGFFMLTFNDYETNNCYCPL